MINNPKFSIIIPNFNGEKFLLDCLNTLEKSINKIKTSFEIILVDNGSHDNSLKIFKKFAERQKIEHSIIKNNQNLGFATAVNQGIKKAKYEWVILLNNDLTFSTDWFKEILPYFSKIDNQKTAAIFGTVLNKEGNKIESQGLKFYIKGKAENIGNQKTFIASEICQAKPGYVWGASAALVIYKKDIIKKIGLFDESFFAYEEDVDVALRLHNLGYKTFYVPKALSFHLGGGTSNKMGNFRNRMDAKNWIYIIIKNYTSKDILSNFFSITEERLRNLSGLIKMTIRAYGFKSIYILPKDIFITYGEVFLTLPKMINKRNQINL